MTRWHHFLGLGLLGASFLPAGAVVMTEIVHPGRLFLVEQMEIVGIGAVLATLGLAILFVERIEKGEAMLKDFHEDIADDIEDVQKGELTWTQFDVLATTIAFVGFVYLVVKYHKLVAEWRGINVMLISALIVAGVVWLIYQTEWFHDKEYRTPAWVFWVPLLGIAASTWVGLHYAEPVIIDGGKVYPVDMSSPTYEYRYEQTRAYLIVSNTGGGQPSSAPRMHVSLPECNGKGCGYVYLAILLILVTLVLVIASALVPHFWLLAGCVFVAIMAMIALHELRVQPRLMSSWGRYRY